MPATSHRAHLRSKEASFSPSGPPGWPRQLSTFLRGTDTELRLQRARRQCRQLFLPKALCASPDPAKSLNKGPSLCPMPTSNVCRDALPPNRCHDFSHFSHRPYFSSSLGDFVDLISLLPSAPSSTLFLLFFPLRLLTAYAFNRSTIRPGELALALVLMLLN